MAKLFIILLLVLPTGLWLFKKLYQLWKEEEREAEEARVKGLAKKAKKLDKFAQDVKDANIEKMKKDQLEIDKTKNL